ncbi:MAG: acyl-ACP--UDP-N-acetylglucosamine O-acyltransferase [Bacteriovoracaceae bacterium]
MKIHTTAIISDGAKIHESVEVGPYSIIGPHVEVGEGTKIAAHVCIDGHTTIGKNNNIFPFCSIGAAPQDMTYKGEDTRVEIGDGNTFREYVSIHRGTLKENKLTKIGSNTLLMAYVHVGHDVIIGDNCIVANSTNFAGHVKVGEGSIIGGGTNISQFVKLGRGSYIGGASAIDKDIPQFCTAVGNRVRLKGINIIGLRRRGYAKNKITEVVDFFRAMESSKISPRSFVDHPEMMNEYKDNEIISQMTEEIIKSEVGLAPFS